VEQQRLKDILNKFPMHKIAVVGDFFLDKWLEIDRTLDEPSVETGLTAYQVVAKRCYAGAAGTVISNLAALEVGQLFCIGFTGDDGDGYELHRILQNLNVNVDSLFKSNKVVTPTYTKPVFRGVNGLEETHRLDNINILPTPVELEQKIIDSLWNIAPKVDAIIALDQLVRQGYGVITSRIRHELEKIADKHPNLLIYADSRAFINQFHNVIVKCNNFEAVKHFSAYNDQNDSEKTTDIKTLENCLQKLSENTGKPVFITSGSRGIIVKNKDGNAVLIPAVSLPAETAIDIVGAGDACSSGIVSTLCSGGSLQEAAFVGNLVASITIQIIGTTGTSTRKQVLDQYTKYFQTN